MMLAMFGRYTVLSNNLLQSSHFVIILQPPLASAIGKHVYLKVAFSVLSSLNFCLAISKIE